MSSSQDTRTRNYKTTSWQTAASSEMQIGHPPSRSSRALASLTSNAGAYADQTKRYVGERVSRLNMQVQIGLSNDERCGACYDYFKEYRPPFHVPIHD
ncbi:hypothetical protein L486_01747 [Kwoniella mangroviensis CBS 10435]|uniref:Uncharacterized protein n=1 Tax=Kwoniella mangroviensis CBS 10435 TaxID=1331196 RepID=A0A1B9J2R4_9TREE|nr:hypothetical protein L486_01747 [Kwoniella mangroviensis CBS 10435]